MITTYSVNIAPHEQARVDAAIASHLDAFPNASVEDALDAIFMIGTLMCLARKDHADEQAAQLQTTVSAAGSVV